MSLSGSIEDLPLLEILQVVSFCQKTGHLTVRAPEGEAAVVFRDGRVVSGYLWDQPTAQGERQPEARVRQRIGAVLERLVRLREGAFAFNLSDSVPTRLGGRDLSAEMLADGINPEELMLELARQLDEDRRHCTASLEASFTAADPELPPADTPVADSSEPAAPTPGAPESEEPPFGARTEERPAAAAAAHDGEPLEELSLDAFEPELGPANAAGAGLTGLAGRTEASSPAEVTAAHAPEAGATPQAPTRAAVLLVDDEAEICRTVGHRLAEAGYEVAVAGTAPAARREMLRLAAARRRFLLVVDLGLPSETGSSFRGGLDVVRQSSGLPAPPPVLLMSETIDEKLRGRARRLGVSLLSFKPGLSKLDPRQYEADLRAFADKLARDLLPRLEGRRVAPPTPLPAAADAAARGDGAGAVAISEALAQIEARADPDVVAFLLLRVAKSLFPRVLLFLVKDERLRGLSGAGPVDGGRSLDLLARELSVPLDEPSPFRDAVAGGKPWKGPLPVDGPLGGVADRIGRLRGKEAAIVPLRASRETIALVYADAPDGSPLPPIDAYAAFVERAGRALEGSLAVRRAAPPPA